MARRRRVARRKTRKAPARRRAAKRRVRRAAKRKSKRKPSAAFMKPVRPDDKLAAVVGDRAMPRTEITKKLWSYIKRRGLQDKKNRRMINADATLKAVFNGRSSVNMFEMTKLVSRHMK